MKLKALGLAMHTFVYAFMVYIIYKLVAGTFWAEIILLFGIIILVILYWAFADHCIEKGSKS